MIRNVEKQKHYCEKTKFREKFRYPKRFGIKKYKNAQGYFCTLLMKNERYLKKQKNRLIFCTNKRTIKLRKRFRKKQERETCLWFP